MVSIIVPVYNSSRFLKRCVESILDQSFQDYELILVNDGSSDNSGEICNNYAAMDSRIRVFHKKMEESLLLVTLDLIKLVVNISHSLILTIGLMNAIWKN